MIIVHHLEHSRSQRILWLLEELEVDYEVKRYTRDKETYMAPDALLRVHKLGKSPVITDTNNDKVIAESGNIIQYLAATYGEGKLTFVMDSESYWQTNYWLHYAEGSLMPFLVMTLVFDRIKDGPAPFFIRPILKGIAKKAMSAFIGPNLDRNFDFIEQYLTENEWFGGEQMSIADIQMIFPLEAAKSRYLTMERYPYIAAYIKRVHLRDPYQRALEKGGSYDYA